jgi:hypothetical protein
MSWSRLRTSWRSLGRRLCAGVTLIAYLAAALGLPLPAAARRAADQQFPCQNHPCGCLTAEECWRHCCCFTPQERWAWAEEHHVQPPAYAERPSSQGWRTARLRDSKERQPQRPAGGSCCSKQTGCPTQATQPTKSCHHCRPQPHPGQPADQSRCAAKGKLRWTLAVAALKCTGHATLWISTGAALPPSPPLVWRPFLEAGGWLSWRHDCRTDLSSKPLDPPPRMAGV